MPTRHDDASSIIGPDLANELEEKSKNSTVSKSQVFDPSSDENFLVIRSQIDDEEMVARASAKKTRKAKKKVEAQEWSEDDDWDDDDEDNDEIFNEKSRRDEMDAQRKIQELTEAVKVMQDSITAMQAKSAAEKQSQEIEKREAKIAELSQQVELLQKSQANAKTEGDEQIQDLTESYTTLSETMGELTSVVSDLVAQSESLVAQSQAQKEAFDNLMNIDDDFDDNDLYGDSLFDDDTMVLDDEFEAGPVLQSLAEIVKSKAYNRDQKYGMVAQSIEGWIPTIKSEIDKITPPSASLASAIPNAEVEEMRKAQAETQKSIAALAEQVLEISKAMHSQGNEAPAPKPQENPPTQMPQQLAMHETQKSIAALAEQVAQINKSLEQKQLEQAQPAPAPVQRSIPAQAVPQQQTPPQFGVTGPVKGNSLKSIVRRSVGIN